MFFEYPKHLQQKTQISLENLEVQEDNSLSRPHLSESTVTVSLLLSFKC